MSTAFDRRSDQRLLDGIQEFVAKHPHPGVQRFREGIAKWGEAWSGVPPAQLPAADLLGPALSDTIAETHALVALFKQETAWRKWEQSYTKADGVVGDAMLAGYGFAEIIGKYGPFLSDRVRSGVGVWGPHIAYPPHRHAAEEVYVVLAGRADFLLDSGPPEPRTSGDVVQVPSMLRHGFQTGEDPLVVFYIWQAGDLREMSTFG